MSRESDDSFRWVAQARRDLEAARLLTSHGLHAQSCFLAQQAAEKALKGILYAAGAEVVIGHSVARLCDEIAKLHPDQAERCAEWATLDQYYIPTRYPDALPAGIPSDVFTSRQAEEATSLADEVVAFAHKG